MYFKLIAIYVAPDPKGHSLGVVAGLNFGDYIVESIIRYFSLNSDVVRR
jgi:hypothetical protein